MDLLRVGIQCQVTVVAAIEACRWIATHDALQQHTAGHLQAPPLEEAVGSHYLAAGYTVQVRGDTFNLVYTGQSLRE